MTRKELIKEAVETVLVLSHAGWELAAVLEGYLLDVLSALGVPEERLEWMLAKLQQLAGRPE